MGNTAVSGEHTRILLVDDHAVMRAGTRRILEDEPDFAVVGEAGDGEEALLQTEQTHPDLVVLDISMPGMDGIQACRELRRRKTSCRLLILTGFENAAFVRALHRMGVDGYVLKSSGPDELVRAIRAVASGGSYFCETASQALEAAGSMPDADLTLKEQEVLGALARGLRNRAIADEMSLSVHTVEFHMRNLFRKFNATTRADALMRAQRLGWLDMVDRLC